MTVMTNSLLLDALQCSNNSRPPIWLMRQAGRHLAKYRALRNKYSFLELCHHPELIAEVTMMPILEYGMDAAILFSDILVVPEAMGVGVRFEDSVGPIIERPVVTQKDIDSLPAPDVHLLQFVKEGILATKKQLKDIPLIGFCGAPFTVASYMIEGKSSKNFKLTKKMMLENPEGFHALLRKIADWSIVYLNMQIEAGVQAVQIFDSWANALASRQFQEFSLDYLDYILKGIGNNVPTILFCRGSSVFYPMLAQLKPSAIGLDWNCSIAEVRKAVGYSIALQGNLDPDILYAPIPKIKEEVHHLLDSMRGDRGFIFNLGHGVSPDMTVEAVRTVVECVKGYSYAM
jgi:uroporphyrinogen decarboxylase